MLEYVDK